MADPPLAALCAPAMFSSVWPEPPANGTGSRGPLRQPPGVKQARFRSTAMTGCESPAEPEPRSALLPELPRCPFHRPLLSCSPQNATLTPCSAGPGPNPAGKTVFSCWASAARKAAASRPSPAPWLQDWPRAIPCAVLSLDDLYRTRAERQAMARQVHPLFATRGVPGTHDVDLGLATIAALRRGKASPCPASTRPATTAPRPANGRSCGPAC
jgi:hypothetical protein